MKAGRRNKFFFLSLRNVEGKIKTLLLQRDYCICLLHVMDMRGRKALF